MGGPAPFAPSRRATVPRISPLPLVGRGRGWGSRDAAPRCLTARPPTPTLPHKGGGSPRGSATNQIGADGARAGHPLASLVYRDAQVRHKAFEMSSLSFMDMALALARSAAPAGEGPVRCVIVPAGAG